MRALARFAALAGVLAASIGGCAAAGNAMRGGATLAAPPGYYAAVGGSGKSGDHDCDEAPAPYTGTLAFRSKYEGSGASRDQLNVEANESYRNETETIREMESKVSSMTNRYMEKGDPALLACAIGWLDGWARADALLGEATTHTGRSMRKWSLGSLSSAYLRLKLSRSQPLRSYPEQSARIENWFGRIASQVVREWDLEGPKVNNHYYWAAWGVLPTAVLLNRRDLYDWSLRVYRIFEKQLDAEGYLPLELDRETRALAYHNYALTPLTLIAAFAKANGLDLAGEGNHALQRLAQRDLQGMDDPALFEQRTGHAQNLEGLDERSAKLAWLEPYCWTVGCTPAERGRTEALRPLGSYRVGGDLTAIYAGLPRARTAKKS